MVMLMLIAALVAALAGVVLAVLAGQQYAYFTQDIDPEDEVMSEVLGADPWREALTRRYSPRNVMLGGLLIMALSIGMSVLRPSTGSLTMVVAAIGIIFVAPTFLADKRDRDRARRIEKAIPSMLDILLLCVRAGLSVERSLERTSLEFDSVEPALAEELRATITELHAGVAFPDAMRRLAGRIEVESMDRLAALVGQATILGTSLAEIFERFSEQQRTERTAALEEFANGLSVKMAIPMALFLLPCCMLMILGPAIVMGMKAMG